MVHKVRLVRDSDIQILRPGVGKTFTASFTRTKGFIKTDEFSFPKGSTKIYYGTKAWSYYILNKAFDRYLIELVFEDDWEEVAWQEDQAIPLKKIPGEKSFIYNSKGKIPGQMTDEEKQWSQAETHSHIEFKMGGDSQKKLLAALSKLGKPYSG